MVLDMLMVEAILAVSRRSDRQWAAIYADRPSRMLMLRVADRGVVLPRWDETRLVAPQDLQDAIDTLVAAVPAPARAFARPSGAPFRNDEDSVGGGRVSEPLSRVRQAPRMPCVCTPRGRRRRWRTTSRWRCVAKMVESDERQNWPRVTRVHTPHDRFWVRCTDWRAVWVGFRARFSSQHVMRIPDSALNVKTCFRFSSATKFSTSRVVGSCETNPINSNVIKKRPLHKFRIPNTLFLSKLGT